ncbi:MAG TPA: aminotransferase class I/II-fold pyridoxal phosphate-dependent enzyme [Longimicrobiales bacterium]|nr:aminotransferase class I/II-fold pyridoxal phosphate-dependent enzyme [Longimicrobiales bacterium]
MKRDDDRAKAPTGSSTRAVHAGYNERAPGQPVVSPIVPAATFFTEPIPSGEVLYTRYGTNPNHKVLAEKLAALEHAEAAIALASGNAATALSLLTRVGAGDHIVAQRELYGGTLDLLTKEFPRLGIETTFIDWNGWEAALRPNTRVLFMEAPVNPTLRVPDVRTAAGIARAHAIPLFIDATFGTPINFRPIEHGATVVIHSATKYFGGHSDLTAGVVAGPAAVIEAVRQKLKSFGPVLDPHAAWLLERGIKTLAVRMEQHNRNGLLIARRLEAHPAVERVFYPGLPSHPDYEVARELLAGFGGMVSFIVRGGDDAALRFCARLQLVSVAPSLGGVESLVSLPRFTSHASLSREERHQRGIGDGFVRVSLGIEDASDLWADLDQALQPEAIAVEQRPASAEVRA